MDVLDDVLDDEPEAPRAWRQDPIRGERRLATAVVSLALSDWRRLGYPVVGPLAEFLTAPGDPVRLLWLGLLGIDDAAFVAACRRLAASSNSRSSGEGTIRRHLPRPRCTARTTPPRIMARTAAAGTPSAAAYSAGV